MKIYSFNELDQCDLVVDAVYEGGNFKNHKDDPINKILPVGNQGGFRYYGPVDALKLLVLYTDGSDLDWPDNINLKTGIFKYYGDNRKPGQNKISTGRSGNLILEKLFQSLHSQDSPRDYIPPIFIFQKFPTENSSRSVIFRGVCVPGNPSFSQSEDLVSIWKTDGKKRFENYRAIFSILDCNIVHRSKINEIVSSNVYDNLSRAFTRFKNFGEYNILQTEKISEIRSEEEQLPSSNNHIEMLDTLFTYFNSLNNGPYIFEKFAAEVYKMSDMNVIIDEVTQNSVDGGRDAVGRYRIGPSVDPLHVNFSLEAKLYNPGLKNSKRNSIGVRETSRLISRIRNHQFGVMVTTSVVGRQAYKEIREDKHPIILITGKDLIDIIVEKGYNSIESLKQLLLRFK